MTEKLDVYTQVTHKIIADLERGNLSWTQPWRRGHQAGPVSRPRRANGQPYRGINVLMLWAAAAEKGYGNPLWLTYKQASELGGQVRKGEKGSTVVYANTVTRTDSGDNGEDTESFYRFLKRYTVFNAAQIDGLPGHFYAMAPINPEITRLEPVEVFFKNTGADIRYGGDETFYRRYEDFIQLPELQWFRDREGYCATLAHETTHWTRHPIRLDRNLLEKYPGREGRAREELVAEIGAALLCADLGITPETRADHAAYIQHWLMILINDKRAIFNAAGQAEKAADYLHGLQQPMPV